MQTPTRVWAGQVVQYCLAAKDVTPARAAVVGQFRGAMIVSVKQLVANPSNPGVPDGIPNTNLAVDLIVFLNPVEDGITAGSGYNGGTSVQYIESAQYYEGPNPIGGTWRIPADY